MSLIPRLPCRKLFIDSRHGEGNATEFSVEIPQGGLDLPDNCVAFIDQISVPSFPNVFAGRHRIYYRQALKEGSIQFRSAELLPKQYTLAGLAAALNSTLTFPLFFHTTVTASDGADTLTLAMTNSPGITGVEGTWGNGGPVTNVSGFVYTNGTNNFEFTEWDAATDFGKMRRTHTNGNTEMYSYVRSGSVQKLTPDDGNGTEFTLPSNFAFVGAYPESNDELRILTDDELKTLTDISSGWDITGNYSYANHVFSNPTSFTLDNGDTLQAQPDLNDPKFVHFQFTGSPYNPNNRFYVVGSRCYLDPGNNRFSSEVTGFIDPQGTVEFVGVNFSEMWTLHNGTITTTSVTIPVTATGGTDLVPSRTFNMDFSAILPDGYGLNNLVPDQIVPVTVTNVIGTTADLHYKGFRIAHFVKSGAGSITLRADMPNPMISATAGKAFEFIFTDFDRLQPGSVNGILNNEHGTSKTITTSHPQTFTVGTLGHQDEACYLHMNPSPNSTMSCMNPAGVRNIVRRIPLGATYPDQNHDQLMAHDADFLNFSRMQLQTLHFSLRLADGTILPALGHTSFSILFAIME